MLIAILEDNAFRKKMNIPYNKRWTVRAFLYNDENKLAFLRIKGIDILGKRDHLETIGGGVENDESLEDALKREVREEIGYDIEIEKNIGYVVDHYNALNRETISNYFVCRLKDYVGGENRTDEENNLIEGVEYFDPEDVEKNLRKAQKRTVNELVQRRDLIAYQYYKLHKDDDNE